METIGEFNGTDLSSARQKLPVGKFQVDSSGDRFLNGAWRPRLGRVHSTVSKAGSPIVAILGFDLPGEDFALMFTEGTNVHGHLNVTEQ